MLVVDSHCHLDYPGLIENIDDVLARAKFAGVGLMLTIGTRVRKFETILKLAEAHENVWCTVGTHPHNAGEEQDVTVDELVTMAKHPKVVGIGEAGLDYHYDYSPRDAQMTGFRTHIEAARLTGLPLVIHSREAEQDTAEILEDEMQKGPFLALLHCYTSKPHLAHRGLRIGAYISFSGILTYKNAQDIRDVAAVVPLDRLLVETDAPYLAPVPFRGKSNEPAFVVETLKQLAAVRHVPAAEMAHATSENFFRLFSKIPKPAAFAEAA